MTFACDKAEVLEGEAACLSLLGELLGAAPSQGMLDHLHRAGVFVEAPMGMGSVPVEKALEALNGVVCAGVSADALREDHLRLFEGLPAPLAPVWESVYFNDRGLVFQEQTLDVRSRYRRQGLQTSLKNREPDDSLNLELQFLAVLALRAACALCAGDEAGAMLTLKEHDGFLCEHTLCWAGAWASLVRRYACGPFYPALADLTVALVDEVGSRRGCVPAHRPLRVA